MSVPTSMPTSVPTSAVRGYRASRAPLASTSLDLLDRSRGSLLQACRTGDAGERYVEAHLGALRAAAALLAARSIPSGAGPSGAGRSGRSGGAGGAGAVRCRVIGRRGVRCGAGHPSQYDPLAAAQRVGAAAARGARAHRVVGVLRGLGPSSGGGRAREPDHRPRVRRPAAPGGELPRDHPGPPRPPAGRRAGADLPLRRTGVPLRSRVRRGSGRLGRFGRPEGLGRVGELDRLGEVGGFGGLDRVVRVRVGGVVRVRVGRIGGFGGIGGGGRSWDVTTPTGREPSPGRALHRVDRRVHERVQRRVQQRPQRGVQRRPAAGPQRRPRAGGRVPGDG